MSDILKISCVNEGAIALGETFPGYSFELQCDVSEFTIHEWFKVFEKVLAASGFTEYVIMKGAVELAFNEYRNQEKMKKIYKEYDLQEFDDSPENGILADEE